MNLLKIFILAFIFFSSLHATNSQEELKAVMIGKFSHFVTWNLEDKHDNFIITVFKNHSFGKHLDVLYQNKKIHQRQVKIKYIDTIEDIGFSHILYVTKHSQEEQSKIIDFAQNNSMLTISENGGFAQRGGVIQLYFVSQKIHLKINNNAASKSNLKISSRLLSIAKVVEGDE